MLQATLPFHLPSPADALAALALAGAALPLRRIAGGAARPAQAQGDTPAATTPAAPDMTAFQIGWDHARLGVAPPWKHLGAGSAMRQGWQAGRHGRVAARPASPAQRQWLALRLQAWDEGAAFEIQTVTPAWLARLPSRRCPITRQPLAGAAGLPMRLNRAAAYAVGNLVHLDSTVVEARDGMTTEALLAQARDLANAPGPARATRRGLDARAWLRLAVLTSFARPLPHAQAACLPLAVLPPARVRVLNSVQALQVVLTLIFAGAQPAGPRVAEWSQRMPDDDTRQTFQIFMHTLLARRLSLPADADPTRVREALEDAWLDPLLQTRWQRLSLRLGEAEIERLLSHAPAADREASRWMPAAQATDGWELAA